MRVWGQRRVFTRLFVSLGIEISLYSDFLVNCFRYFIFYYLDIDQIVPFELIHVHLVSIFDISLPTSSSSSSSYSVFHCPGWRIANLFEYPQFLLTTPSLPLPPLPHQIMTSYLHHTISPRVRPSIFPLPYNGYVKSGLLHEICGHLLNLRTYNIIYII